MCEKAQKDINKREELWDWYYDKESETIEVVVGLNTDHPMGNNFHKDEIPLYRQDQLQAMLEERKTTYFFLEDFTDFIILNLLEDHGDAPYIPPFKKEWARASMEQLWLAFVMHEKYQEKWNNEKGEWVID